MNDKLREIREGVDEYFNGKQLNEKDYKEEVKEMVSALLKTFPRY